MHAPDDGGAAHAPVRGLGSHGCVVVCKLPLAHLGEAAMKLLITLRGRLAVLGTPDNVKAAISGWNGVPPEQDHLIEVEEIEDDAIVTTQSYLDSLTVPW
jgi:homoserine kinase